MNLAIVFNLLGKVILCEGALLTLPIVTSMIYAEQNCTMSFLVTLLICGVFGGALIAIRPKQSVFHIKEGFVITALSWIVISIIGSLPFIFTGSINNPIDALFETVSGFTTTGASILPDVESLPKSVLLWRSFTHWIGGMGVLVFILMIKPLNGGSHTNLMKAESPGPQVEKLVPRLHSTAKILYGIYIVMTVVEMILLVGGGMDVFDAITLSFGTAGTGGFGVKNTSISDYSVYSQWVITTFMILFGVNFGFYFLVLQKKIKRAALLEEVRWYFIVILFASAIIFLNIRGDFSTVEETARHSLFQVGAIITTTGYSTVNFNLWPALSKTILVILMFVGACAGSTGGGIKISRILMLCKTVFKEFHQFLHPKSVKKISMDGKVVPHEVIRSVNVYMITYLLLFTASVLLVSFDNYDLTTNFTAVAATFNNIGPGLELVGPVENFGFFSNGAKLVLIFDMLAGRLELFPLLMLFSRETWKKF